MIKMNFDVGSLIRKYRDKEKMSLRSLSELTSISFSHLCKIERGEHNPSKTTLDIISETTCLNKTDLYLKAEYASDSELA